MAVPAQLRLVLANYGSGDNIKIMLLRLYQTRGPAKHGQNFPNLCGNVSSLVWKFVISGVEMFRL